MKETKSNESGNVKKLNAVKKKKKNYCKKMFLKLLKRNIKTFSETPRLLKFNA